MRILTCAIHQPNLFPRLSTLAKLYAADIWIVLDDVQFNYRDYQHRARLAAFDDATHQQWLSLPVHRPFGRSTRINEVLLLDPDKSARRVMQLVQQHYGRAPYWNELRGLVQEVAPAVAVSTRLADVTEVSTRLLLKQMGWRGSVVRSSELAAIGADEYLCGTGGAKYLDEAPFREHGIHVRYVGLPDGGQWQAGRKVSALHWMVALDETSLCRTLGPASAEAAYFRSLQAHGGSTT
jgi:hypothetical protein